MARKIKNPAELSVVLEPGTSTLSVSKARQLDAAINKKIKDVQSQLARAYIEVGQALQTMRDLKGYEHLGFSRWEDYLDSKQEFGRTYLSYLFKLGRAGNVDKYLDEGISGTKLIEFAKRTDYPEKIPVLIEATWEEVKDKPVRETGIILNQYVKNHTSEYKKPRNTTGAGRKPATFFEQFLKIYDRLPESRRSEYIRELKTFIKEIDSRK